MGSPRDFSRYPLATNIYDGASEKCAVNMDGGRHLIKFGTEVGEDPARPDQTSYVNAPLTEYLGSKIVASLGIPAQEVELGTYKGRSAVACLDFTDTPERNLALVPFKQLETSLPGGSAHAKGTPDLTWVLNVFDVHSALEGWREAAKRRFWQTLVADALIANADRHTGNWGYIVDTRTPVFDIVGLAPVYDCGSSLYSRATEAVMERRLADIPEFLHLMRDFPTVKANVSGRKPRYGDFLLSAEGAPARRALLDLWPAISLGAIEDVIDTTPGISTVRRAYYKMLIERRLEMLLRPAYELAREERSARHGSACRG